MILIDTNILVRFFTKDNYLLYQKALKLITKNEIFLDEVVLAETIWVLSKVYQLNHSEIAINLINFLQAETVHSPKKSLMVAALLIYQDFDNLSYVDCWSHIVAKSEHLLLTTFDKKLHRYHQNN